MPNEKADFDHYLTRHYAHLGDQAKHREGKKRQLLRTYRRWLPDDREAPILEIGPGYGQLLELLRKDLGYARAEAVDVSGEVVDFCNQALPGSTTRVGDTLEFLRAHPRRFDRVFALHVLEHLPGADAVELARGVAAALRPSGCFVVEVPNMANLFTGAYLRYADLTHAAGYSETSLRHLLETAGFAAIECFEDRLPGGTLKGALASLFRGGARFVQRAIYKGYELPVPAVLTPALCAVARPDGSR